MKEAGCSIAVSPQLQDSLGNHTTAVGLTGGEPNNIDSFPATLLLVVQGSWSLTPNDGQLFIYLRRSDNYSVEATTSPKPKHEKITSQTHLSVTLTYQQPRKYNMKYSYFEYKNKHGREYVQRAHCCSRLQRSAILLLLRQSHPRCHRKQNSVVCPHTTSHSFSPQSLRTLRIQAGKSIHTGFQELTICP